MRLAFANVEFHYFVESAIQLHVFVRLNSFNDIHKTLVPIDSSFTRGELYFVLRDVAPRYDSLLLWVEFAHKVWIVSSRLEYNVLWVYLTAFIKAKSCLRQGEQQQFEHRHLQLRLPKVALVSETQIVDTRRDVWNADEDGVDERVESYGLVKCEGVRGSGVRPRSPKKLCKEYSKQMEVYDQGGQHHNHVGQLVVLFVLVKLVVVNHYDEGACERQIDYDASNEHHRDARAHESGALLNRLEPLKEQC